MCVSCMCLQKLYNRERRVGLSGTLTHDPIVLSVLLFCRKLEVLKISFYRGESGLAKGPFLVCFCKSTTCIINELFWESKPKMS